MDKGGIEAGISSLIINENLSIGNIRKQYSGTANSKLTQ
jgi:hypothetical protein